MQNSKIFQSKMSFIREINSFASSVRTRKPPRNPSGPDRVSSMSYTFDGQLNQTAPAYHVRPQHRTPDPDPVRNGIQIIIHDAYEIEQSSIVRGHLCDQFGGESAVIIVIRRCLRT